MLGVITCVYTRHSCTVSDPQKYYAQRKKQPPKFNPGKREPSPLLASKIEGSVVEVKSTTLTESGKVILLVTKPYDHEMLYSYRYSYAI